MNQPLRAADFPPVPRTPLSGGKRFWRSLGKTVFSPSPYLAVFGIFLWMAAYWLLCEYWKLPRFVKIPGPVTVFTEWLSPNPGQGISIFMPEYYKHIYVSCRRILFAFALAVAAAPSSKSMNTVCAPIARRPGSQSKVFARRLRARPPQSRRMMSN